MPTPIAAARLHRVAGNWKVKQIQKIENNE